MSQDPRARAQEWNQKLIAGAKSFVDRARSHAGVSLDELIDPDGEAVASLVDVEASAGAASLALPIDLITFDSWVLGHLGDRDDLDLDVNTHQELWFGFGSWIGEMMRMRHGGFWLFGGEDPRAWRIGFTKIMLEITPHIFAERLLKSGPGMTKRMLSELERIRGLHEQQLEADGGKPKDRYAPQHYMRMHSVPLAQWLVIDLRRVLDLWGRQPVSLLREALATDAKRLPPQNAGVVQKIDEVLAKLDQAKPVQEQPIDRGIYEAVAQICGIRRANNPIAVDIMEKIALPALHMGVPTEFPPLGEDDVENVKKGTDLFGVMVDVVPFAAPAEEGGFLGSFAPTDLSTPYPDRKNLELGKGDWVAVNPQKIRPLLEKFDPQKLLDAYGRFVEYVQKQPHIPRLGEISSGLAETAARVLLELRASVAALSEGLVLVFRLLPPPG
jgi:hypothetical protein